MAEATRFWNGISQSWIEFNNLCWNFLYQQPFGHLAQMPLLGANRVFVQQLMQAIDAWANLYPASVNYQIILTEIQLQSLEAMGQELMALAEKGESFLEWQQVLQLWSRTADRVFEQVFCSEDNLRVRGQLLNALNHSKCCQQQLMETWMQSMNLPTRSEIDEVHQTIYELQKQLKSLKKTLAQYELNNV